MKILRIAVLLFFVLISCQKEDETNLSKTYDLSGFAQKGPFLIGSEVTIIELNNELNPTGKVFFSTIEDNSGYFSFPDVVFESDFVQIKVEGEYYNEVVGCVNSMSEIILYSIVDISDNSIINVNIITHLVQARANHLFKEGINFSDAYNQAFNELLAVFYVENIGFNKPEKLDLTTSDSSGGILLLISSIIQSNISSGMIFSEFLTSLTNDFKDNGNIDNEVIQKTLATSGLVLNLQDVRNNLISRYADIGRSIEPYSGNQFLKDFNNRNSFTTIFDGVFPVTVGEYKNLINKGDTVYIDKNQLYTIAINGKEESGISNIQIAITSTSNNFSTSGVDWYIEGNTKRYLKDFDNSDLTIPIEFTGSGSMELELFIVVKPSGMIKYPKIEVIWN
jgi:hypothetical protein